MKKNDLALSSFRVHNFKAVQDSEAIQFTPLTAFIGNNGSGKSSIVEALETLQILAVEGIDAAMQVWHGFEYVWNRAEQHELQKNKERPGLTNPMIFDIQGVGREGSFKARLEITATPDLNKVFFENYYHYSDGEFTNGSKHIINDKITDPGLKAFVENWQFIGLIPQFMTEPVPQKRSYGKIRLDKTGLNIAEYLQSIRDTDIQSFDSIIETLKVVLPYLLDLQPVITSELERKVYLTLSEKNISGKLPGWLLSTGTLRILCLLAVLHHPEPPSVVIIEELENGLDPRTVHLLTDEIRYFVESGRGQVILTTHSPYLLDLLSLSQIIVTDRDHSGSPQFIRPASKNELKEWAERFSPGKLYTMGVLTGADG
ncbi:AAA family ATPase [Desulfobacterales bacterium HSG2]|nr:AAA family ATPase [Desulfobacterales bacterium HSG2]